MTLNLAYSELTRVLPWSIRALGYPFGTAERASTLVANAAALHPSILADFVKMQKRAGDTFFMKRGHGVPEMVCDHMSFLEIGPVVIDYLAAHVSDDSVVAINVAGASDKWLIDSLLVLGMDYGMIILAIDWDTNGVGWSLAQPRDSGSVFWSGYGVDDVIACFQSEIENKLTDILSNSTPSGITFVGISDGDRINCVGAGDETINKKLANAHARGIPVTPLVLNHIYELEMITWAPTSERSRAQAGFVEKSEFRT
jgi:hypothetical protein